MGKDKEKKQNKAKFQADMVLRLQACLMWPENQVCAECPERHPTMASLLLPPAIAYTTIFGATKTDKKKDKEKKKASKKEKDKGKMMGVFVCKKCSSYHMELGRQVCEVKNIKLVEQWTEETVSALELSGNQVVNAVYEANMLVEQKQEIIAHKDEKLEQDARCAFVACKYKDLEFFCEKAYKRYWKSRDNPRKYGTIMSFAEAATRENEARRKQSKPIGRSSSDPNLLTLDDTSDEDEEEETIEPSVMDRVNQNRAARSTKTSPNGLPAAQALGYGNADNIDYTNPACLADLGYGAVSSDNATEDLGYGEANPDSAVAVQEAARRSVRSVRRGSIGQRRGSVGGPGGMTRPKSAGTLLELEKGGSNHGSRLNARFGSVRTKKDASGLDGATSSHSRRSMRTTLRTSGGDLDAGASTHSRRRASLSMRISRTTDVGEQDPPVTPNKPRRQRRGSVSGASNTDENEATASPVRNTPTRTRSSGRQTAAAEQEGKDDSRVQNGISNEDTGNTHSPARKMPARTRSSGRRAAKASQTDELGNDNATKENTNQRPRNRSPKPSPREGSKRRNSKLSLDIIDGVGSSEKPRRPSSKKSLVDGDMSEEAKRSKKKPIGTGKDTARPRSHRTGSKNSLESGAIVVDKDKSEVPTGHRGSKDGSGIDRSEGVKDKSDVTCGDESDKEESYKRKYQGNLGGIGKLAIGEGKESSSQNVGRSGPGEGDQRLANNTKDTSQSGISGGQDDTKECYKKIYQGNCGGIGKLATPNAHSPGHGEHDGDLKNTPSAEELGYEDATGANEDKAPAVEGKGLPSCKKSGRSTVRRNSASGSSALLLGEASAQKPRRMRRSQSVSHGPNEDGTAPSKGDLEARSSHKPSKSRRMNRSHSVSHGTKDQKTGTTSNDSASNERRESSRRTGARNSVIRRAKEKASVVQDAKEKSLGVGRDTKHEATGPRLASPVA